jgi:predicted acetyltransferase
MRPQELELLVVNSKKQWHIFNHILQLYEYEFSNLTHLEIDENGLFINEELEKNIHEKSCICFLLRSQYKWAGLSVVNLKSYLNDDDAVRDIAEFFILKLYRKKKLGYSMAKMLFEQFPGKWEIRQLPHATESRNFWLKVLNRYCPNYTDQWINHHRWNGYIQTFETTKCN